MKACWTWFCCQILITSDLLRLRSTSLQKLRSHKPTSIKRTSKLRQSSRDSFETVESELYSVFNETFGDYSSPRSESPETRPVERAVEARAGSEDGLGSMVRCLYFSQTFIVNRKFFLFIRCKAIVIKKQDTLSMFHKQRFHLIWSI